MTNRPQGALYVGVTADLAARVVHHRDGKGAAFCRRYNLTRLVLAEPHAMIGEAIAREKALKAWQQKSKIELVGQANPECRTCSIRSLEPGDPSVRWDDGKGETNGTEPTNG